MTRRTAVGAVAVVILVCGVVRPAAGQVVADPAGRLTFDVPAGMRAVPPADRDTLFAYASSSPVRGVPVAAITVRRVMTTATPPATQPLAASSAHRWHGIPVSVVQTKDVVHRVRVTRCVAALTVAGQRLEMAVVTRVDRGPPCPALLGFALDALTAASPPAVTGGPAAVADDADDTYRRGQSFGRGIVLALVGVPVAYLRLRHWGWTFGRA